MKIVLTGEEAEAYMRWRNVKHAVLESDVADTPTPRKSRAPKSTEAKAKDIGQTDALPEPASAKPEPAKPLDTQAIVKAWAAKFGTPKLVEKLTAAGVRRVPEIKPEHLPAFLADLQKDLA